MNREHIPTDVITRYESYLRADPRNIRLWIETGDLYHQTGSLDEAQACFEKALLIDPEHTIAKGRLANVLLSQQRFADAEQLLRTILADDPDNAALHHNLGLTLYYQRRWEEAEHYFAAADQHGLTVPTNLAYWARSLHYQEKLDDACLIAQRWMTNTKTTESKAYLALLEMDNGNMAQAEVLALEVLREDSSNTDAATVAGNAAIEQQRVEDGLRYFQSVIDANPEQGRAWFGAGLAHLHESHHIESIQALERATTLLPGNAGVLVTLGWAYIAAQDAPQAERIFRKAIDADHNLAESHGGLAVSLLFQQKITEARAEAKVATKLDSQSFGALYANAILLKLEGRGALAEKMIAKTLDQAPVPGAQPLIEYLRNAARKRSKPPAP